MAEPPSDDRLADRGDTPETAAEPRPAGLALLLGVGGAMAALVLGLVWSTGRGLQWW